MASACVTGVAPSVEGFAEWSRLQKAIGHPPESADLSYEQRKTRRAGADTLYEDLDFEAKRLNKKYMEYQEIKKQHAQRVLQDDQAIHALLSLDRATDPSYDSLKEVQAFFRERKQKWRFASDDRERATYLLRAVEANQRELDAHLYASAHAERKFHNPHGRKAECVLLCGQGKLAQFAPSWCNVVRYEFDGTQGDLSGFPAGCDAVVVAFPSTLTSWVAQQVLRCDRAHDHPRLWLLLGDCDSHLRIPDGDLVLDGPYGDVSFTKEKGTYRDVSETERLLWQFGCAISRDPDTALNFVVEKGLRHPFSVVVNRVRPQFSPLPSQCSHWLIRAQCFWNTGFSRCENSIRHLTARGFEVFAKVKVEHSSTAHEQPQILSAEQGKEFITRNCAGKVDEELIPHMVWHEWGSTVLGMPFDAYLQLKEHAGQHPDAVWVLPCELGGKIVWEEAQLHGVELSGPFHAHLSLPVGHPAADVQWLAGKLVDVGLGARIDFPGLNAESPEILPVRGSKTTPTIRRTAPGSLERVGRSSCLHPCLHCQQM